MKITSVSATPVSVPTCRPCAWSGGTGFGFTRTILELTSDDGRCGLGECEGSTAAKLLNGPLGRKLLGLQAADIAGAARICHMDFRDYGSLADINLVKTYAAIEMAMWDLTGKSAELPVYRLLGGPVRQRARFSVYGYTIHLPSSGLGEKQVPDAMARLASEAIARTGAGVFEFKVGRFSPQTDIETIRAVRAAVGPEVQLRADANQALDLSTARRILRAVRDAELELFEEPVAAFADMQRLHEEFRVPLSSHCIDLEKMLHYPAIEGIVGDLHLQGGLLGLGRAAAAFHGIGRRFWQRASLELGISWAAMVHASMAYAAIDRPSQSLIDYVEDDLITGPAWYLRDGAVEPPDRPGLGVELDRDALAGYAEHYRERGEYTYFDGD